MTFELNSLSLSSMAALNASFSSTTTLLLWRPSHLLWHFSFCPSPISLKKIALKAYNPLSLSWVSCSILTFGKDPITNTITITSLLFQGSILKNQAKNTTKIKSWELNRLQNQIFLLHFLLGFLISGSGLLVFSFWTDKGLSFSSFCWGKKIWEANGEKQSWLWVWISVYSYQEL